MCRMVGVIAESEFSGQSIFSSLRQHAYEHHDGWGIAHKHATSRHWSIERGLTPAYACSRFQNLQSCMRAPAWLAHLRLASVGGVNFENTHPFHRDGFVFCHNGTLAHFEKNRRALDQSIDEDVRVTLRGSTDSERLFALFLTLYRRTDERLQKPLRLAKAAGQTVRYAQELFPDQGETKSSLNLMLSDGETLVATRHGRTLHVGQFNDAFLVASDTVMTADWSELADNDVVSISRGAGISRFRLNDLTAH